MTHPTPVLVFDLDGTLAETAGDLMGTLNVILTREGLAPLPLARARSLLGAGAKALIARGFAAVGQALTPEKLEGLYGAFLAHYNAHIADNSWLFPVGGARPLRCPVRAAGAAVIAVDFRYTDVSNADLNPDRIISHFDQLWDSVV